MKLIIDIPDTQYNNIMEVKSMSLGRIPYKGIIMNAIRGIQNGRPLEQIRAEIEQNAYPIVHGVNNHEKGMTLYGILQIIDKYRGDKE